MMRCSYPYHFILLSLRPTPSPRLSSVCLLDVIPRPRGVGCANGRSICGCGRGVWLRASRHIVSLSRYRSFAIVSLAVRVFISRLALLPRFSVGSCSPASGPVSCSTSRASPCLFHPSRSHATLVRSCLVPPLFPHCLSLDGAIIEAVAVCGPSVSLLASVVSASVVSVRSRSPVAPRVSVCLLGGWVVSFLGLRLCGSVVRGGLHLRYALRPAFIVSSGGAIVVGLSRMSPACLPVRSFVSIVCCLSLFVYIVP